MSWQWRTISKYENKYWRDSGSNVTSYQVLKNLLLGQFYLQMHSSVKNFALLVMLNPLLAKCFNFVCIYYAWWTLILLLLLFCLMDFNLATFNIATLCFPLHARVLTRILERWVPGLTTFENGESHQILVSPSESHILHDESWLFMHNPFTQSPVMKRLFNSL